MNILVLCTGNSCRSQMMHGFLNSMGEGKLNVYSAGVETHGLNPFAVGIMTEEGILIHEHTSNHVDEYADVTFDYVITVCDHAKEVCPVFPNAKKVVHHSFSDPSHGTGTAKEIVQAFRTTRGEIKEFAENFVQEVLA